MKRIARVAAVALGILVLLILGVVGLLLLCVLALILSAHRSGVLERLLNWMGRVPLVRRLAARLEPKRAMLLELDQQITEFYHRQPGRFAASSGSVPSQTRRADLSDSGPATAEPVVWVIA